MHIINSRQFGEIEAFQFGYGPVGRPFMSVYVYAVDGVIIDTGQSNMRKYVIEQLRNTQPHKILLTHHHEDHSGNAFALDGFQKGQVGEIDDAGRRKFGQHAEVGHAWQWLSIRRSLTQST